MATDTTHRWDPARCPLCGGPNDCALAIDPEASECWCDTLTFPRELLAQIPEDAVRKTCVCQACFSRYMASAGDPGKGARSDPSNAQ
jgi:hypothetical protein